MLHTFSENFGASGFMPHGYCFLWTPSLLWVDVASDLIIAASYLSIPFALWYFAQKRPDVPFRWIFVMFGAFVLACATTHLFAAWNIWHADYWAEAVAKAITAGVSAATAILLWPLIPRALTFPSSLQLANANQELRDEMTRRQQAESALLATNETLERRVAERTTELEAASASLRENEARFRSLTGMSSDFYWESDAEHRLIMRGSAGKKVSTVSIFERGAQIGERRWDIPYLSPDEAGWQAHRAMLDAHLPFRNFELSRRGDDGSERFISISGEPVFDAAGAFKGYRGIGTDVTARKAAAATIQRHTQFYAALSQCNEAIVRCTSEGELFSKICHVAVQFGGMKMAWIGMIDPDDPVVRVAASSGDRADEYLQGLEISVDANSPFAQGPTGTATRENRPVWCQDFQNDPLTAPWHERGARFGWHASAALPLHRHGVPVGVLTLYAGEVGAFDDAVRNLVTEMATDISFALDNFARESKRKQAEEALARESHRNRVFLRNASDGVHILDVDGNVLEVSDSFCEMLGYSREELLGANVSLWDAQWSAEELKRVMAEQVAKGGRAVFETRHRRRDGSLIDVEIASQHLELNRNPVLFASARDITERKLAAVTREQLAAIVENSSDAIYSRMLDGTVVSWNPGAEKMLGYTASEVIGKSVAMIIPPGRRGLVRAQNNEQILRGETIPARESTRLTKDGRVIDVIVSNSPVRDNAGRIIGASVILKDITEYKHAQDALRAAEEQFRGLVEQSIAGIYIIQDDKFAYVNPRFAEIRGFGSADELIGRSATSLVAEKDRSTVVENNRRLIAGEIQSIGFTFTALRKNGSSVDVGVHSSSATYRGRPAIIGLLQDISEKKRAEEEIQHYVAQLRTAFMSTVEVATTLSEMRDPYTAGHERRVGKIAAMIGAELGLDEQRIEGLHVAGNLHDIGKITIPAEILSKPGKLTQIEYQLIQGHPQSSYDVLKEVEFPWPVAQVALQHHERMDGSGYPQGLKGEAILFEARIMAVADVVEAMSSHRPYRPGLGIDKALAEIERGRGTAYDADVVDACLRLFRTNHYQLPE